MNVQTSLNATARGINQEERCQLMHVDTISCLKLLQNTLYQITCADMFAAIKQS